MAQVPLIGEQDKPELTALVTRIKAERGGRLLNLYKALLNSPPIAEGWPQTLIRAAFGNNNTDTCARVCHSPTGFGLSQAFGTSAGTQDFKSVESADVVLLIGANPTVNHPVAATFLKNAVKQRGAKLIVMDPRRQVLSRHAYKHLAFKPGSDVAMLNAMIHVIIEEGLVDLSTQHQRLEGGGHSGAVGDL